MTALRALMADVDGVVIIPPPGGWAARLEEDLGLSVEVLQAEFFNRHWPDVVLGRAGLHERLAPVLAEHAPHVTPQQLCAYWFEKDAILNEPLLADLAGLRTRGVALHLATVQEHLRAAYIWDTLGFRDRFDAMHYAAELGWRKSDPEFYTAVEARTGFAPEEMLLLDDTPGNVEAATAAGWRGAVWDGSRTLGEVLAEAAQIRLSIP